MASVREMINKLYDMASSMYETYLMPCDTEYSDDVLNRTLGLVLGKEVSNWKRTIRNRDDFKEFVHFERYLAQQVFHERKSSDVTTELLNMFIDVRRFAAETFDPDSGMENSFYNDRQLGEIVSDPKYKTALEKLENNKEMLTA